MVTITTNLKGVYDLICPHSDLIVDLLPLTSMGTIVLPYLNKGAYMYTWHSITACDSLDVIYVCVCVCVCMCVCVIPFNTLALTFTDLARKLQSEQYRFKGIIASPMLAASCICLTFIARCLL